MSDRETLEEFTRRYDILVGVGGGLTATDKQVAAIRGVLEENKRLRDPCAAAGRHVCGPGDAEARIDAVLALHYEVDEFGEKLCKWCGVALPCPTVKALKGERG